MRAAALRGQGITIHGARRALSTGSTAALPHSRLFSYLVAAFGEAAALLAGAQVTSAGIFLSAPIPPPTPHPPTALLVRPAIFYLPAALTHWCIEAIHQEEGNVSLVKSLTDH